MTNRRVSGLLLVPVLAAALVLLPVSSAIAQGEPPLSRPADDMGDGPHVPPQFGGAAVVGLSPAPPIGAGSVGVFSSGLGIGALSAGASTSSTLLIAGGGLVGGAAALGGYWIWNSKFRTHNDGSVGESMCQFEGDAHAIQDICVIGAGIRNGDPEVVVDFSWHPDNVVGGVAGPFTDGQNVQVTIYNNMRAQDGVYLPDDHSYKNWEGGSHPGAEVARISTSVSAGGYPPCGTTLDDNCWQVAPDQWSRFKLLIKYEPPGGGYQFYNYDSQLHGDVVVTSAEQGRRHIAKSMDCLNPATGATATVTGAGPNVVQNADGTYPPMEPPVMACPTDMIPVASTETSVPSGGANGDTYTVRDWALPGDALDVLNNPSDPSHGCMVAAMAGNQSAYCPMALHVDTSKLTPTDPYYDSGGSLQPCVVNLCANWPSRLLLARAENLEDPFICKWGTLEMQAEQCKRFAISYNPETTTHITSDVDPEGRNDPSPELDPVVDGFPEPTPQEPAPQPQPDTGTGTGTGSDTEVGIILPEPGEVEGSQSCNWGDAWSLNPVDWVLVPVKCSFEWAMIPTPEAMATFTALRADIGARPPFSWIGDLAGMVGGINPGSAGCLALSLDLNAIGGGSVTVLDSCAPDPVSAWFIGNRGVISAVVWVVMYAPLVGWAWRQYAPGSQGVA